ncbi:putative isomerase YbhE [Glonium stellatum]|uniref:Putative isomerase YbhE n=1 Tax=Glonium stellatum TaxID=574774 RepID=A0A8E2JZD7_9PEZI|nr:putative isomerase YbhE [Glonium stellatum]
MGIFADLSFALYTGFFILSIHINALPTHSLANPEPWTLYVAQQSTGILTLAFDPSKSVSSSLEIINVNTQAGFMPGWVTTHEDKLYSIARTHYPTTHSTSGGVFSFQRNRLQGHNTTGNYSLQSINSVSSKGTSSVACDVSKDGKTIGVANIDGSTVSIHPLSEVGVIGEASYVFKYNLSHPGPGTNGSQIQSNPHEAIFEPSGQYMFVTDRGADRLYVYRVAGPFDVLQIDTIVLPPGTGPRHLTFRTYNSSRTYMYLVSELDNTVRVFTLDGLDNISKRKEKSMSPKLTITLRQTASTLGPGSNRTAPDNKHLASEVAISADGKFVYASNRNTVSYDSDTLTIFSVHPDLYNDEGHLVYLGSNLTYGKIPRHFSLSKDMENKYIAVANEVSQSVMVLERDAKSGFISKLRGNITLGGLDITQSLGPAAVIFN